MTPDAVPTSRQTRGFTLVEALAALAIFAVAVLVAAAFLQAHSQAARRLEVRSALVHAAETVLEEVRGGARSLGSVNLGPGAEQGLVTGTALQVNVKVDAGGAPDLYRVIVTTRSAEAGEPMVVEIESMVWRP